MSLKKFFFIFLCLPFFTTVNANEPGEKFSYCSNGTCRVITTDDFFYARNMPRDLNFSCKKNNHYALTFDDGPSGNYPKLLEVLKKHQVKATFFVVGANLANVHAEKMFLDMAAAGHFMANHTLNHTDLTNLPESEVYDQIETSRKALVEAGYSAHLNQNLQKQLEISARYVRPPFGNINLKVDEIFKTHGFIPIRWNADRYDWNLPANPSTVQQIVSRVQEQLNFIQFMKNKVPHLNESILDLNHDWQNSTIEAVDIYIPLLKAHGYEFVDMQTCINGKE